MTAAFVASLAAVMLLVCGGVLLFTKQTTERAADTAAKALGERIAHDVSLSGPQAGLEDEQGDMRAGNLAMLLLDSNGRVIRQSPGRTPSWPPGKDDGWRITTEPAGGYTVAIGQPWDKVRAAQKAQAATLALLSLCVVVAAAVGAWMLVGRTLGPIDALARQAQAASAENLRVRLESPSADTEVVRLVETLNGLLGRVAETAAAQGRFYAAASHELRTPLQALFGHLEMARSRDRTVAEHQALADEACEQTRRLISLVQSLLLLNQLETAPSPPAAEALSLADICERAIAYSRALIAQHDLRVRTGLPTDAEVFGPPAHVEMLVRNLIDNAVKYAAPSGQVCIEVTETPEATRLEIFNECPPVAAADAERLGEPFFRPDESRDSATGGNGLGLAICKAITSTNGWDLALTPVAGGFQATVGFGPAGSGTPSYTRCRALGSVATDASGKSDLSQAEPRTSA